MDIALSEAKTALQKKEVPVGCAVLHNGTCIARAHNLTNELKTPLAHAEMLAFKTIPLETIPYTHLFVTCEPCIMCMSLLAKLGVPRITYGCSNPKFGGITSYSLRAVFPAYTPQIDQARTEEAILLLQEFYTLENKNAPEEKRKDKSKRAANFFK